MTTILRGAGFVLHPIAEVYPNNAHKFINDPEWIKLCGENNWVVISGDKRLETVPENRQAVIDAKAKVFLLTDSNSFPEIWAAAVIVGRYKIQEIIDANPGPFFVNITKRADTHVARLRLPYGYVRPIHTSEAAPPVGEEEQPPQDVSATETAEAKQNTTRDRGLFEGIS